MQLVEYVNSLFEQGLSAEEVIAKTQEWKKKNQPKEDEVKTEGVAETTDATVPPKTPDASENLESGSGKSQLNPNLDLINRRAENKILDDARANLQKFEEKKFDFNKIHENVFGKSIEESEKDKKKYKQDQINSILKKYEPNTPERAVAYYQLDLAPDSTVDTKTYEAVVDYNENLKNLEKLKKGETKDAYNIQGLLPEVDATDIQRALSGVNRGEEIPKTKENEKIKLTLENLDNISKFMEELDKDPDLKDFKSITDSPKGKLEIIGDTFLINMPLGLEATWEATKGIVVDGLDQLTKQLGQTPDFLIESASAKDPNRVEFVDPQTNERILFSENPEKWKELKDAKLSGEEIASFWKGEDENEIGNASDTYVISQFKKYQDLNNAKIKVGEIVKEFDWRNPSKIKFSSGNELFGGVMSAIEGTVASVIPAMVTGGASLIPQIGAPIYMDYNIAKANSLYPGDPDALNKLIYSDQTDFKTPAALTALATSLEYIGFRGVAKHMIGKTGRLKPFVSLLYSQLGEGTTEWGQFGIEELNKSIAAGKTLGESMALAVESMASKDGVENFLMGVVGAGSMGVPGTIRNTVSRALITETEVFNNATKLIQEISSLQQSRSAVNNKAYKDAVDLQIQEKEESLKDLLDNTTKLASMMTKEEQNQIIDFLGQKNKNNKTLSDLNKSLDRGEITAQQYASAKGGVVTSNKSITNKIDRVLANANKRLIEGEVAIVEDVAGKENVETFNTVDEFVEATGQSGKVDAFIDESGKIFINKQRAAEVGAITAGSHELLHRILRSTFESDPNTALKLVESFKNTLSSKELNVIQKRIDENYRYDKDGNERPLSEYAEEYLTSFSDAIGKGEITYKDNLKETFMRLAKPILDIFRPRGYNKLNFKDGRDVYNFIKDYQKNIKKGKISERAQKLQELEEVDLGTVKRSVTKESKRKLTPEQDKQAQNKVKEIQELQKESEALAKKYKKYKKDSEGNVLKDKQGNPVLDVIKGAKQQRLETELAADIKPTVDSFVENRTKALYDPIPADAKKGVTRQEFIQSMKSDISTMINNEFEAKQPLEKFITSRGFLRANSLAQRLGIKSAEQGIDQDIDTASNITTKTDGDTDANLETETRTAQLPRATTKFTPDFVANLDVNTEGKTEAEINEEVQKQFDEAIAKDLEAMGPVTTFGQTKNIGPELAALMEKATQGRTEVDGKIVKTPGMPAKVFTDKTKNIAKKDATSGALTAVKQYLDANAQRDFNNLPDAFAPGTGKATFIPENVKKALYKKNDKGQFVLDKSKTLNDYKDLLGEMEKPVYRASEAQTIKGLIALSLRNRIFEQAVPDAVARSTTGVKFSQTTAYQNLFQALPFERVKDDFSTLNNFRWGAILQATLKGSGVSPIDMKTAEGRQRFKDYAVSSGLISKFPKDFWRSMQGTTENLLKDETKKFGEAVKESREFVESLIKDPDVVIDEGQFRGYTGNLPFINVKEVNEWIAETEANGGVFAKDSQLFSDMLKKENPTAKRLPMEKALNDPAFIKRQENSINGLKKVFEIFQDAMKTPEGIAFVAAIMSSSGASQNHFIRKSAPWKFYQKGYLDQAIREEHTLPASLIGKYLFMSALGGTVSSDFKNVKKNFFQGALLKTNDDKLKGFKPTGGKYDYVESTPEGWKITDNIWARYFNINVANTEGGINPQSIMLANNKSVFDLFNVTPSGLKLNEQGVKDLPKVEKALDEVVPKSMYSKTIPSAQQNIYNQGVLDGALNKARRPDAPVKKIRVFDFDDTLARSKSKVLYTVPNVEGGFSEGATNLKAIFMVGGPGAGKTNVGKGLQLGRRGYKVVNQDIALEAMKEEAGLPAKESDYTAEQRSTRSKLGAAARKAAVAKFDKYAAAGNGMVIDGTGASYNATTKKIKALQDAGFEVHMVVAMTPLETAIERNRARAERSLPDFVVEKTYNQVQESLAKYRKDFGDRLYEINTETIEYGKPLPNDFLQKVYAGINANKVGKVDAGNFATQYDVLESQGAEFDFREFSKVIEGEKGPLFSVAQKIAKARGTEDIFILTARPADAAKPIQEFMKANGIDIPLQNITGLGDGTASAKGRWIAGKAAEGYNDFYFADDAIKNVEAVKEVLSQVDVKSKVQQAKFSKTKVFDKVFNDIIEAKTGIESYKQFSAAKAKTVGSSKGKFTFFTTPSAEDFLGLLYKTLGKGKVGDAQMAFYKENLLDPFNRAEMAISQAKVAAGRDYKALKKQFKGVPKTLEKETGISKYSYQHAIRTYIWDSQGIEVPGLSKRDQKRLTDFIKADPELQAFADQLVNIQKGKPYPKPDKDWTAGNITTDVISGINKVNRAEYLQEWQENVDIIFSEKNMNKLEAAFGAKYVEALKDSLRAMKSGSNRPLGGDRVSNQILDWLNNSVGAIMFLNTRSAVLQTISAVNFINWGDNNILKAGKAFANQKQFWSDFLTLMNSDYLLERRDGLKINVSESEIADAVEGSKNKVNAAISYLLNKGFVFTRYADSFAIASGGATFYRNRIESLVEQGMDRKLAEQQAFEDFRLIAEENQQSSSPMRISQQQRSLIGRIVLQFGNTQLQYVRIQKRAVQDLVNGRGDWRANISKIVYYGAIQNLMFNALQSGLAWALFDDDEDDEELTEKNKEQKLERALNGAIDSQLKGLGIQGAVIAGVKNSLLTIAEQTDKKSPKFEEALDDLLSIAPALGSKIRKLKSAARTVSWNRKEIKEKGFSMDNPAYLAGAQTISAIFNIPLDRAVMKMNNMRNILNPATQNWQKVALALGWSGWDVGLPYFGLAEDKPVLTETEKQTQKLFNLNKSDQVKMLLDLGLTKKEIRALTKEDDRVKEIIKLQNKKKDGKNKS